MATNSKPSKVPNWADATANILEPSEPYKTLGWALGVEPPSNFENYKANLNGNWWRWIDERFEDGLGEPAKGTINAISSALLVVGADTDTFVIDDGVNPAVTFAFDDDASVVQTNVLRAVNHTGLESSITMAIAIRDAINAAPVLSVTASKPLDGSDVEIVNDAIGVAGNNAITEAVANVTFTVSGMLLGLDLDDTLEFIDPVASAAIAQISAIGFKMEPNLDFIVSGTGKFKHGSRERTFHAFSGAPTANIVFDITDGDINITAASTDFVMPIVMNVGETIESINYRASGGNGNAMTFELLRGSGGGVISIDSTTDSTIGLFNKISAGIEHKVEAGFSYFIMVTSAAASTTDQFSGAVVTYRDD